MTAAPQPPAVARFEGVTKTYAKTTAVDDISLSLHPGETVALLGPNGAGKSTTLDMLLGLREPDAGRVELCGTTPRQAILAGRVGAMLQSGGLMEDVTVGELVGLACSLHPKRRPLKDVLRDAEIEDIADRRADKLSGGQTQRVRFALAVAGDSDLIVLDEPTVGMDVTSRQAFWQSMRTLADAGRTVLFATHYLEEADSIADRVLVLNRGRLIADGTAAEIKARAGARRISFDLVDGPDGAPAANQQQLSALPSLEALEVHGRTVRMRSADADATVAAIYGMGLRPKGLEVTGLGLEQAFLSITGEDAGTVDDAAAPTDASADAKEASLR
jgi:ABC-2 type transport system ATP-binding protein